MPLSTPRRRLAIAALAAIGAMSALLLTHPAHPPLFVASKTLRLRYFFTARNTTARALHDVSLVLFLPRRQGAAQRADTVNASLPATIQFEPLANQSATLTTTFPPFGQKVISLDATVHLAAAPLPEPLETEKFLEPEPFIESDDSSIHERASRLSGTSPREIALQAQDFVRAALTATSYTPEDRGAAQALSTGRGDCTEFAYLFVALLRARGIPSRVISGFVVEQDTLLRPANYHNWAEFYDGERWRLADPHSGVFDEGYDRYVTFRVLSAKGQGRIHGAQRFAASAAGVEIEMGP